MSYYATVDDAGVVTGTWTSVHDAGHAEVIAEGARRGGRWVYVEESVQVGDQLQIDEDGCARIDAGEILELGEDDGLIDRLRAALDEEADS